MYFLLSSPKILKVIKANDSSISQIKFNNDKTLFVVLTDDSVLIYNFEPCILLVLHKRQHNSLKFYGLNINLEWKSDSNYLVISTAFGYLLLYKITYLSFKEGPYKQIDPPQPGLRRSSAELLKTFHFPKLKLSLVKETYIGCKITCIISSEDEIIISNSKNYLECYTWDLTLIKECSIKFNFSTFFKVCQSFNFTSIIGNTYIIGMEFSSSLRGFSFVLKDGCTGFLTCAKLNLNQMRGLWIDLNDGTCTSINNIFRLIAFGQKNSHCSVYKFNRTTDSLSFSHKLIITEKAYPNPIGPVHNLKWSPDGRVLAVAWETGGVSLWSTFGSLLMCSLTWDYGPNVNFTVNKPFLVDSMDWSEEGYNLFLIKRQAGCNSPSDSVLILSFAKSSSSWNHCNNFQNHICLQSKDKLYIHFHAVIPRTCNFSEINKSPLILRPQLIDTKQWVVVQMPTSYYSNCPIKYSCIDHEENKIAIAGQTGLTHYSFLTHKWTLFGNETQEKEMIVHGGLVWWKYYIVAACLNIPKNVFELRLYNSETALSNMNMFGFSHPSKVVMLNLHRCSILTYGDDRRIRKYNISENDKNSIVFFEQLIEIDMLFTVNPSCIVGFTSLFLRLDHSLCSDYIIFNMSGQLFMINLDTKQSLGLKEPLLIANNVESVWFPDGSCKDIKYISDAVWLYCGVQGMNLWFPSVSKPRCGMNSFMSERIMLSFQLKIYPLLLFQQVGILVGIENDTMLQSYNLQSPFSLPFCILRRNIEAYLPHIFRELIYRNLSSSALEIACYYKALPHFPHCLELLLLEILEEEATCETPLSDAKLPNVLKFIKEFPFYPEILLQCARKTELSLWPYLFSVAGRPSSFLNQCLNERKLETAAAFLIILQNLEPSHIFQHYATLIINSVLSYSNWKLSKELFRFLKAIDSSKFPMSFDEPSLTIGPFNNPNFSGDLTSCKQNLIQRDIYSESVHKQTSMARPEMTRLIKYKNQYDIIQTEYLIDSLIENHARSLLKQNRLKELGFMCANLDFQLTEWLIKERNLSAVIGNFLEAFKTVHSNFSWPYPTISEVTLLSLQKCGCTNSQTNLSNSGDSGYLSIGTASCCQQSEYTISSQDIDENSAFSEADSLVSHKNFDSLKSFSGSHISYSDGTDISGAPSREKSTTNLSETELQLRYLRQIFLGTGCLQWAFLLSVILRDEISVSQVINAARSQQQTHEAAKRLQKNFNELLQWTSNYCLGYSPFMSIIQCHMVTLSEIIAGKYKHFGSTPDLFIKSKSMSKHNISENNFLISNDTCESRKSDSTIPCQDNEQFQCVVM